MSYARSPGTAPSGPTSGSVISRPPAPTIFIGNIPYDLTEAQLVEIFQEVGAVKSLRLVSDRESGKAKGYGFCEYYDVSTAEGAVRNLNGHEVHGRQLRVDFADEHIARGPREKDSSTTHQAPPPPPPSSEGVGLSSIKLAACQMSFLLGGSGAVLTDPVPLGGSNEKVYDVLARMSKLELFEVLAAVKSLVQTNFNQARQLLIQNPQLARSLFQIEVLLGLVDAPGLPTKAQLQDQKGGLSQRSYLKDEPAEFNSQNASMVAMDQQTVSPEPAQQHLDVDGMEGVAYASPGAVPSEMRGMDAGNHMMDRGSPEMAHSMNQITMNGGGDIALPSAEVVGGMAQHSQMRASGQIQASPQPMQVVTQVPMGQQTVIQPMINSVGPGAQQLVPNQMGLQDMQQNPTPQPFPDNTQKIGDQGKLFGNVLAAAPNSGQGQVFQAMNAGVASGALRSENIVGDMGGQGVGSQSSQLVGGAGGLPHSGVAGGMGGVQNLGMLAGGGGMQMSAGVGGLGGQSVEVGGGQPGISPMSAGGMDLEGMQGDAAQQAGLDLGKKALLDQIMSLTPTQINLLPPEQRTQVLALQQQLRFQM